MPSSKYDVVRDALLARRTLIAKYDGFPRELCPWALGTKEGVERALFYQSGGLTSTGPVVPNSLDNWRCMDLARLEIVEVVDGAWVGPTEHRRVSHCLDVIDFDHAPR